MATTPSIAQQAWLLVPALLAEDTTMQPSFLATKAVRLAIAIDDAIQRAVKGETNVESLHRTINEQKILIERLREQSRSAARSKQAGPEQRMPEK